MPLLVTLHVFSGRENPRWIMSGADEKDFRAMLEKTEAPAGTAAGAGGLGYSGFSVEDTDADIPRRQLTARAAPEGAHLALLAGVPALEEYLLGKGGPHIEAPVAAHVREMLRAGTPAAALAGARITCPACVASDAPAYNPAQWNTPQVQPHNNCYNYANNQITNTFAQPGRATGHMYTQTQCPNVQPAAQSDGLKPSPNFSGRLAPGQGWYVALVMWPNVDYHWYRQDKVGCWSHKPGQTAARNVDNSGNAISDPRTCNRGNYTQFCTYMITGKWVHIR